MPYEIEWKRSAVKELRKLDPTVRRRVVAAVEELRSDQRPAQSTRLVDAPAGCDWRRIRAGNYCVVYQLHDDQLLVLVLRVGHRGKIYRRLT